MQRKWRNLWTTLVRRMEDSKSESKAKKPYYLNETMQFTIPFVKTCAIPSGNLSPIPNKDFVTADVCENSNNRNILNRTNRAAIQSHHKICFYHFPLIPLLRIAPHHYLRDNLKLNSLTLQNRNFLSPNILQVKS